MHGGVQTFLEQRGEDFDANTTFDSLVPTSLGHEHLVVHCRHHNGRVSDCINGLLQVLKAQECEFTTGPAQKPEEQVRPLSL